MKTYCFVIKGEVPGKLILDTGEGPATPVAVAANTPERGLQLLQERLKREVEVLIVMELEGEGDEVAFDEEFVNV